MQKGWAIAVFYISAIFNWAIAAALILMPEFSHKIFMTSNLPESFSYIYLFAALVLLFGIGYFWAARNFAKNRSIIKLGALGKVFMFICAFILVVILHEAKPVLLLVGISDLVFAILFYVALRQEHIPHQGS